MSESNTVCVEMSQDAYLKMIEDNPALKEKLETIGLSEIQGSLAVRLNYPELLTKEEKETLRGQLPSLTKSNERFVKFGDKPNFFFLCSTNEICDKCYQGLLYNRASKTK